MKVRSNATIVVYDDMSCTEISINKGRVDLFGSIPIGELPEFCAHLRKYSRTANGKAPITRSSPISRDTEIEWCGDVRNYDPDSMTGKVAKACKTLAKKPITRGDLMDAVSRRLKLRDRQVLSILSVLLHKEEAFNIYEEE